MLKLIRGYTFAALAAILMLAAPAADSAQLTPFTGPAGTNPIQNPTILGDANQLVANINTVIMTQYQAAITPAASSAAIQTAEQTFTITGLLTTDTVYLNPPAAPTSLCPPVTARVSAANTLAIGFSTLTAAACTPTAGTYKIVAVH